METTKKMRRTNTMKKKKELIQSCMRKDANYQFLFVNYLIKIFDFCLLTNFLPKFLYPFLVDYILLKKKILFRIFGNKFINQRKFKFYCFWIRSRGRYAQQNPLL